MFTKALVPLDGTEVSEGIIPFVTQFARGLDIGVVLATAVELDPLREGLLNRIAGGLTETPAADALRERIERDVKNRLEDLADRMALEGIAAETSVRFGPVSDSVIAMAQDAGCDLIAMSTRGRGVVSSGLLGSVTYKIMHESPIPVLAITPERAGERWDTDYGVRQVIVPLDGSDLAEAALPYAAAIAGRMNMKMTLVRAMSIDNIAYSEGYNLGNMLNEAEAEIEADARRYLISQARRLREEGLDVQTEILRGSASSEIVAQARQTDHNMIALATHGRSGVNRLLMGSVAEAVVRASGDPVLVVRPSTAATPDPAPSNAPVVAT
ncbi:MAG: universal stress protein [Dehalococcoidia bacterium]|nr:universal stress protein [Dehalococcoidia bacterium]